MIAMVSGGVILGIALGLLIARLISRPLRLGVTLARALASGDLTTLVAINQSDEVGELVSALNDTMNKLGGIVGEINASSNEQNRGASQITQALMQLDQVTQQNASASEELAAPPASNGRSGTSAQHTAGRPKPIGLTLAPTNSTSVATQTPAERISVGSGGTVAISDRDDSEFEEF